MTNFNSNILVMTDSLSFKVPENREEALNQESELRQQITELDKLIETKEERSFIRILTTLQFIILQRYFRPL